VDYQKLINYGFGQFLFHIRPVQGEIQFFHQRARINDAFDKTQAMI
jgi:hypothetical protein